MKRILIWIATALALVMVVAPATVAAAAPEMKKAAKAIAGSSFAVDRRSGH